MSKQSILLFDNNKDILGFFKKHRFDTAFSLQQSSSTLGINKVFKNHKVKVILTSSEFFNHKKDVFKKLITHNRLTRLILLNNQEKLNLDDIHKQENLFQVISFPISKQLLFSTINLAIRHYDVLEENQSLLETTSEKLESIELTKRQIRSAYYSQISMSSTISHELRTPLAAMKMAIDIVLSGTTGPLSNDQRRFLKKAKENIDRLKRLIDAVLDISKLESGRVDFNFKYNNINNTIKQVVSSQELMTKDKGLYFKMDLDEPMILVPFDDDRIHQVLNNLISNAIKFTKKGGVSIHTQCLKNQNFIQFVVKDTGIGISEEDIPKLFKKFMQLGNPEIRKSGGTGLGLSICDEIIKKHGGKIWIESKINKGTGVFVNLPIEERRKMSW